MKLITKILIMLFGSIVALAISQSTAVIFNLNDLCMLAIATLLLFIPASIITVPGKEVE